jgi:hypothetical protein
MPKSKLVELRQMARGYSVARFRTPNTEEDSGFTVALVLDGVPYHVYGPLSKLDSELAVDDLSLLPGPRGDSSIKAVMARCMLKSSAKSPNPSPTVFSSKLAKGSKVGTWEWVQSLSALRQ